MRFANLHGLLLFALGLPMGLLVALRTDRPSLGLLSVGILWFMLGWPQRGSARAPAHAFARFAFLPLVLLSAPVLLAGAGLLLVEQAVDSPPTDPRDLLLQEDERLMSTAIATGDLLLAPAIHADLRAFLDERDVSPGDFAVHAHVKPGAVLVLVQIPTLRHHTAGACTEMIQLIRQRLRADRRICDRVVYVALKGQISYGAILLPSDRIGIGRGAARSSLYPFFDEQSP